MAGAFTLPRTLRMKCSGGTGFSAKNMLYLTPKLSSKPGITIINKLFWYSKKIKKCSKPVVLQLFQLTVCLPLGTGYDIYQLGEIINNCKDTIKAPFRREVQ